VNWLDLCDSVAGGRAGMELVLAERRAAFGSQAAASLARGRVRRRR